MLSASLTSKFIRVHPWPSRAPRLNNSLLITTIAKRFPNPGLYGRYNGVGEIPDANSRPTSRLPRQRRSLARPQRPGRQAPRLHVCAFLTSARQSRRRPKGVARSLQDLVRQHMLSLAPRNVVEQDAVEEICSATRRLYRLRAIERKAIDLELATQSSPDDLECTVRACGAVAGKNPRIRPPAPNSPTKRISRHEHPNRRTRLGSAARRVGRRAELCPEAFIHGPSATHPSPANVGSRPPKTFLSLAPGRTQEGPKEGPRKNPGRTGKNPGEPTETHEYPATFAEPPNLNPREIHPGPP